MCNTTARGPAYYYARYGGRAIIHSLILLYFFKDNVLDYFGLQDMHKGKAIGTLIAVTSALFGIATAITWLSR